MKRITFSLITFAVLLLFTSVSDNWAEDTGQEVFISKPIIRPLDTQQLVQVLTKHDPTHGKVLSIDSTKKYYWMDLNFTLEDKEREYASAKLSVRLEGGAIGFFLIPSEITIGDDKIIKETTIKVGVEVAKAVGAEASKRYIEEHTQEYLRVKAFREKAPNFKWEYYGDKSNPIKPGNRKLFVIIQAPRTLSKTTVEIQGECVLWKKWLFLPWERDCRVVNERFEVKF
ncbi:MAG: hypothetical protein ACE5JU_17570 [Candidatus Binatia bacterium]